MLLKEVKKKETKTKMSCMHDQDFYQEHFNASYNLNDLNDMKI